MNEIARNPRPLSRNPTEVHESPVAETRQDGEEEPDAHFDEWLRREPHNSASPSLLTANKISGQAEMFANRLRKRYRHLRKWARRIGCDAFRLYDRDIPEIPLVLDVYAALGTNPSLASASEHPKAISGVSGPFVAGALYRRSSGGLPSGKMAMETEMEPEMEAETEGEMTTVWLSVMKRVIGTVLAAREENIFLKQRERQRGNRQYSKVDNRHITAMAREKDMRFIVNLSDYLDTGLFLDARKVRSWLRDQCVGKRVLNLFCYTGSLSVAAVKGGAVSVDSVDLSPAYLAWAQKNFALNDCMNGCHRFIRADVPQFIEHAIRERRTWDLVILDPPVFSNSKKTAGFFDVKRGHRKLIQDCLSLLAKNGTLLFGVKLKRFSLDAGAFPSAVVTDMTGRMRDEDFCAKSRGAKNRGGKWYVFQKKTNADNHR